MIVSIILGILNQYPEYFYKITPNPGRPFSLRVAIGVVPTMVTITMIWLIGKLSSKSHVQALAKIVAWMLLISATWANLTMYFAGVMIGFEIATNIMTPSTLGYFTLCPIFSYRIIIPKYRDVYPNVHFLKRKIQLLFLIMVTHILFFFLFIATH